MIQALLDDLNEKAKADFGCCGTFDLADAEVRTQCGFDNLQPADAVITYNFCDDSKVHCDYYAGSDWGTGCYGASSYHPGGVNAGLVDGSVRFVSETINNAVWQAAGSIDGGGKKPEETNPDF